MSITKSVTPLILLTIVLGISIINCNKIPGHLLHCYRSNETQPFISNTLQILIELIQKIEDANPTSLDITLISTNIFHKLRFDGIERAVGIQETENVTPYGASGIMTPKFRLLLQLISDSATSIEFSRFLTRSELCMLHRLISSSVEPYERGDEIRICQSSTVDNTRNSGTPWINKNKIQGENSTTSWTKFAKSISRCPIELGTIRTQNYGSISPGTFIASVVAGLQPQNVRISEFINVQKKKVPFENLETMDEKDTLKTVERLLRSIDSMDNTYSAGLAGDLAEVCVYQGPYVGQNVTVGYSGIWNDTYFPRIQYLTDNGNNPGRWEMTNAEVLAGIDSLFVSQQISHWVNRVRRLRLSQILDMFYSSRGIPSMSTENVNNVRYPTQRKGISGDLSQILETTNNHKDRELLEYDGQDWILKSKINSKNVLQRFSFADDVHSACDRKKILDIIDRKKLYDETFFFGQVLQFMTSSFAVSEDQMRQNCYSAVDKFFDVAKTLVATLPECNDISFDYSKPNIDLTLIIDGSRDEYGNLQLISHIIDMIDVSSYGSYISVIHGTSGEYLVNRTNSIAYLFEQLHNFTQPYPTHLSLSLSFQSVITKLAEQREKEQRDRILVSNSLVILVVSQSHRINENDFKSARRMMESTFLQFPELYFTFVTNDPTTFSALINDRFNINHRIQNNIIDTNGISPNYKIIRSDVVHPSDFSNELREYFKRIPKRVIAPFCANAPISRGDFTYQDQYEEYLSPNQEVRYIISPYYIRYSKEIRVQFHGVSYGDFTVCISRQSNMAPYECKTVEDMDAVWLNVTNPCENIVTCPPIYISALVDKSSIKCSENDCRYPDQVRFIMRHDGLQCEDDHLNNSIKLNFNVFLLFFNIYFIKLNLF